MSFLRNHWFDLAGVFGAITLVMVWGFHNSLTHYEILMWLSLASLFFHQLEEYRIVGTFPGMVNKVMFGSSKPDRYPLNTNTALIINVFLGWVVYLLSALAGERFIWLGMASIIVSLGNIIAHVFIFNIKGKTLYNAGMMTAIFLFIPIMFLFFYLGQTEHLFTFMDYLIGIPLGIIFNYFGVLRLITWLADKDTRYIFARRYL